MQKNRVVKKTGIGVVVQLQPLLTIPRVAELLGVSRPTVYELIRKEGLPTMKLGRSVRVDPNLFKEWLAGCKQ